MKMYMHGAAGGGGDEEGAMAFFLGLGVWGDLIN
jgi:hypothetical protein